MKKLLIAAFVLLFAFSLAACDQGAQAPPTVISTPVPTSVPTEASSDVTVAGTDAVATATSLNTAAPTPISTVTEAAQPTPTSDERMIGELPPTSVVGPTPGVEISVTPAPDPTAEPPLPEVASPSPASAQETTRPGDTATIGRAVTGIGIDYPLEGARVALPIHVQARTGRYQSQVVLKLKWADGQELENSYKVIKDKAGNGWVVSSLDYSGESAPPDWKTQSATLQMLTEGGKLLDSRKVQFLADNDPGTQYVSAAFFLGEESHLTPTHIVKTKQVAAAALNELLWGIGPRNFAGFTSSIPSPEEVIAYKSPGPNWGPRVTLRKVTIASGVATADFSPEMLAYGGGAARVEGIKSQITQTLKQFPSVSEVRILVDGKPDALQP